MEGGEREELPSEAACLEFFDTGEAAKLSQLIEDGEIIGEKNDATDLRGGVVVGKSGVASNENDSPMRCEVSLTSFNFGFCSVLARHVVSAVI